MTDLRTNPFTLPGAVYLFFLMAFLFPKSLQCEDITLPLDEIRKERVVCIDQIKMTLKLDRELWLKDTKILATVFKNVANKGGDGFHRLQFWTCFGDKCRCLETHDAYASVDLVPFESNGSRFLFTSLHDPSAGAIWTSSAIYYADASGKLQNVALATDARCYSDLPPLSLSDPNACFRTTVYHIENNKVHFRLNIWKDSDLPNFPTGGVAAGILDIVRKDDGKFVTSVSECNLLKEDGG